MRSAKLAKMRARLAPKTFKIAASPTCRSAAVPAAPIRTTSPVSSKADAAHRVAAPSSSRPSETRVTWSRTRIAVTLGSARPTARMIEASASGAAWTVAIRVWGAPASAAGFRIIRKLMPRPRHSTWRRLATRAVTGRPSTLTVTVDPTVKFSSAPSWAEKLTNGSPA